MITTAISNHSLLLRLQEATARRLRRQRQLSQIPILIRRNGEAAQKIHEAIAARGLCILILPPKPTDAAEDLGGVHFSEVSLRVRIIENAYRGNWQWDALGLAELVSRVLHGWAPPVPGVSSQLTIEPDDAWDMPDEPDSKGRFKIDVNFVTSANIA